MTTTRRNIELKARYPDLARGHEVAEYIGAAPQVDQHQIDTYFHATHGRLKLREINGDFAQLIAYARPDEATAKGSNYTLVEITQPAELKEALARSNGIWLVVDKQRAIYLWENVRIHLDEVASIGTFLEFEAVLNDGRDDASGRRQLTWLSEQFGVRDDDLIISSYSDLLDAEAE